MPREEERGKREERRELVDSCSPETARLPAVVNSANAGIQVGVLLHAPSNGEHSEHGSQLSLG
jgi:hypothetical protein